MKIKKEKRKEVEKKYVKELKKLMKDPRHGASKEDLLQHNTDSGLVHKRAEDLLLSALDDLGLKELVVQYIKLDCNYDFTYDYRQN